MLLVQLGLALLALLLQLANMCQQPFVLSGGGHVGDKLPRLQDFIEHVVDRHPRNPIVIFPKSLHFQDRSRLQPPASVLQRDPDLNLVLRNQVSLQFA